MLCRERELYNNLLEQNLHLKSLLGLERHCLMENAIEKLDETLCNTQGPKIVYEDIQLLTDKGGSQNTKQLKQ